MKLASLRRSIWDSDEKRFFGRTGKGWKEICVFFIVFYIIMLSYFCATLSFCFHFIPLNKPAITGSQSFLETPGLGMRPLLTTENGNAHTTLIRFTNKNDSEETKDCIENIEEALKPYREAANKHYRKYWMECNSKDTPTKVQSCIVDYRVLVAGGCSKANGYGFYDGKPCILLRLNNVYGWKPDPYTGPDSSMPKTLKEAVKKYYADTDGGKKHKNHLIWVHCEGEDKQDEDNLGTDIEYTSQQGFPVIYYPYQNQMHHLQPAIMVKFKDLTPNIVVKVVCETYARNIEIDHLKWIGSFHMELLYIKR